ncbi:MAG TPA: PAS domain S-box protein, partial [Chloroflexi bacterium]|nr:PAS domain S-box protein [Chloroflexota bacterium]
MLPFFLVTAMCAGLAAHAWRRRATAGVVAPAALMFTLMMFGTATYAFSYAMQLGSTRLTAAIWWSRMSAPGALILGSAWLLFVLEYTARHARVTRLAHRWLWFIPLIVVLANWTNDLHGLYGTYRTLHITETYSVLLWDRGIIHNAGLAYSYIAGVVGITLLALSAVSTPAPYRRQEIWLIVGALAPLSVHIIMTTFLPSRIDIDPTAFAMALAGLIWSHGLFGLGLLDIVPMAQEIVLAGLSDGIIVLDERNRVVSLNPAAERIVARSVEEVVGLPIEPLLPTHCLPADDDEDALFDCENEQGRRSYEVRYAPLRRRDGYFIGRLVTLHDVTHRLQMQRAVEEAKESYQTLFDNAGDAIFIHDLHGRFLEANRIACERLGYTRDELLQMSPQDLDDPEHAARVSDRMAKLQSAGYAQFETVHRRRDGTTFPVEIVARVVEYHGEKAVLAVARDITERKLAEAALRWDEMLIDTLMEQVPDRIYFKDLRSRFIRINHAMARYFGLDSPDDAVGKTDFDFFTEEHARPAFEDEQRIIETGEPIVNKEEKEVLIDGRVSWALTTKLPLYDSDGKLMGTCGISRDITERKEISRKLQETTDELERFFTVSLDMLCIADLDGYFRRVNKAWEKGLGYSVEELEGRRFIDFVHPDDVEMTLNELRGLSSRQPILDFTNRYRRRDGSYRYIEWSSQSQGRVAYSAARDITDRIASEEALRQSEAQ